MWNVFKFFFIWFWLAVAGCVLLLLADTVLTAVFVSGPIASGHATYFSSWLAWGVALGFLMCIPSYFIARPKRQRSASTEQYL